MKKIIATVSVLAMAAVGTYQYAHALDVSASATIANTITIAKTDDLTFGAFATNTATNGATVSVSHDGNDTRAVTNDITLLTGAGAADASAATFTIAGAGASADIDIIFNKKLDITTGGGTAIETLTVLLTSPDNAAENANGNHTEAITAAADGSATVHIGGQITGINTDHEDGDYTGTFQVTAAYN